MHIPRRAADLLAVLAVCAALTGCTEEPPPDEIPPPVEEVPTPPAQILPTEPPVIDPSPSS